MFARKEIIQMFPLMKACRGTSINQLTGPTMKAQSVLMMLLTLLLALSIPRTAAAQVLYGSLTGNVTDQSGAAIPGAKVEARNVATGVAKTLTTDANGGYLFNDLQPGLYRITIE